MVSKTPRFERCPLSRARLPGARLGHQPAGNGPMGKNGQNLIGQNLLSKLLRPAGRLCWMLAALAAVVIVLTPAGEARAQGAVRSVHNDWQIRCDTPPGAQTEQCALIQSVTADDRPNIGLTVIILKTADKKTRLMRVIAQPGVLLHSGLGLKIEKAGVGRERLG